MVNTLFDNYWQTICVVELSDQLSLAWIRWKRAMTNLPPNRYIYWTVSASLKPYDSARLNRCSEYRTEYRMRLLNSATAANKSFTLTTVSKRQKQNAPTKSHDHNKLSARPNIPITLTFSAAPPRFNLHCLLQPFCIDLLCFVWFLFLVRSFRFINVLLFVYSVFCQNER